MKKNGIKKIEMKILFSHFFQLANRTKINYVHLNEID